MMLAAKKVLLLWFGNARSVIDSPTLLEQVLSLPRAAMCALLHSPDLTTDSEESVLLLFSGWCEGQQGKACTVEEVLQLNGAIRYSCVCNPYLTELCHKLSSPKFNSDQLMELWHFGSIPASFRADVFSKGHAHSPEGWFLPVRPRLQAHLKTELKAGYIGGRTEGLACSLERVTDGSHTR